MLKNFSLEKCILKSIVHKEDLWYLIRINKYQISSPFTMNHLYTYLKDNIKMNWRMILEYIFNVYTAKKNINSCEMINLLLRS